MTTDSTGRKKSNFPTQSSVLSGASMDYFVSGTNYQISYANFIAGLGVTGSLVAAGSVTGSPVLDIQGAINNIRTLENGYGVKASISPENGITLDHNFTADTVGSPLLLNPSSTNPTIASIVGSSSIAVQAVGNHLVLETTDTPITTKTVIINEASDFPVAVGGVITLEDNTDYFITNDVTVADRFVMGLSSQLRGTGTVITTLTYTGVGSMLSGNDCDFRVADLTLAFPNGPLHTITSSTAAGIGIVAYQNTVLFGHSIGNVNCRIFSILIAGVVLTNGGLTSTATTMDVLSADSTTWIQFAGTGLDLGTTIFESVLINNSFASISAGAYLIDGLANSANITATGEGLLANIRSTGDGDDLGANITPNDDRWLFESNNRIRTTVRDSICSMQSNATETVIAVASTPVKIAGTFVVGRNSGFTPDTTGRATYNLATDIVVPIGVSLTAQMATGGNHDIRAYISVNGVVDSNSGIGTTASSAGKGNISLTWQSELSTDDYLEVWIENTTDTTNIIVADMVFRVN